MGYMVFFTKVLFNRRGISLVELLVSLAILSMVLAVGYNIFTFGYTSFNLGEQRFDAQQNVRLAADFITQELRYATHVRIYESFNENFSDPVFVAGDSDDYNFIYVKNGFLMFRSIGREPVKRFESIAQEERVSLDLEFIYDGIVTTPSGIAFTVEYKGGEDNYSIGSTIRFLNSPLDPEQIEGTTGAAIAYRSNRPPQVIPIVSRADLDAIKSNDTHTFAEGTEWEVTTAGGLDKMYDQKENIDMDSDAWDPIGRNGTPFTGSYNGNGFWISNLTINRTGNSTENDYYGLFGVTSGAKLEYISLKYVDILARRQVGGLVGHAKDGTTIENCSVEGRLSGNGYSNNLGGLVGWNENSDITNSYFSGTIDNAGSEAGGLVGTNSSDSIIDKSYTTGTIISSSNDNVGGLVGVNGSTSSSDDSRIIQSFSSIIEVNGNNRVGGLVGRNDSYSRIDNSYATGKVTGNEDVGGLVGNNRGGSSYIDNSYSIGEVGGSNYTGGLVGRGNSSNINNSYWDKESSDQGSSVGGLGHDTDDMLKISTYSDSGWDIKLRGDVNGSIWSIDEGTTYPCLQWQRDKSIECPKPSIGDDFVNFVLDENVFVYGTALSFQGGNVIGPDATMVIRGNLSTQDTNQGANLGASNIYIDGYVKLLTGSASLGSQTSPGDIHINGDLEFGSGNRNIYGDVYVNGNFYLKDARIHGNVYVNGDVVLDWTPWLANDARIYYTGSISWPTGNFPQSVLDRCIHQDSVPAVVIPDHAIPELRPDSWYIDRGYRTDNPQLANNIKIFSNGNYTSNRNAQNVIIVSKGDITITGWRTVTGVFYAPYGKITFDQGYFEGLIIAKDGFFYTGGGGSVTFKGIENYIDNPADYPF